MSDLVCRSCGQPIEKLSDGTYTHKTINRAALRGPSEKGGHPQDYQTGKMKITPK